MFNNTESSQKSIFGYFTSYYQLIVDYIYFGNFVEQLVETKNLTNIYKNLTIIHQNASKDLFLSPKMFIFILKCDHLGEGW